MMHISVLLDEVLAALLPAGRSVARGIDGTCGAGGHTRALLARGAGEVLALDVDAQALHLAAATLAEFGSRAHLAHASYTQMAQQAQQLGWQQVDAILLDLGLSSMQLDTPERGFAFRHDAPLDMRFNPQDTTRPTAADLINTWAAADLARIFAEYGEERFARPLARALVAQRPFSTTRQLAEAIAAAQPLKHPPRGHDGGRGIHPATRIFQALRIAVNEELAALAAVLPVAVELLRPGGRLAVISFHSLEDRLVKQFFKEAAESFTPPPGMASLGRKIARVDLITRKPIEPTADEIARNPRSRSARLRVVEKRPV
ncbi:MAG: 16S rRNA (cytosine(1402)-N(4))-methyltransferase RsmH [Anaerolineae bacterium]|jgi:16S rRNA (cytosine1402-N4)-methyltransferase|nr:16S rRNA (cytosine(1402)-N(4))-methyltransferase RsmH [Anaerolineae bacterium]